MGFVRRPKMSPRTPAISLGPALVKKSLQRPQDEPMMRMLEVQIGNSGQHRNMDPKLVERAPGVRTDIVFVAPSINETLLLNLSLSGQFPEVSQVSVRAKWAA
jgi:hypothetical protein